MKENTLPWAELTGPVYPAQPLKQHKEWVIRGTWMLAFVLIAAGVFSRYHLLAVFGVLYVLTLLMKKDVAVTERGIESYTQMKITNHYDLWRWDEIERVVREVDEKKYGKRLGALYFRRGERVKTLYFPVEETRVIMHFAKQRNPHVLLAEADSMDKGKKRK